MRTIEQIGEKLLFLESRIDILNREKDNEMKKEIALRDNHYLKWIEAELSVYTYAVAQFKWMLGSSSMNEKGAY